MVNPGKLTKHVLPCMSLHLFYCLRAKGGYIGVGRGTDNRDEFAVAYVSPNIKEHYRLLGRSLGWLKDWFLAQCCIVGDILPQYLLLPFYLLFCLIARSRNCDHSIPRISVCPIVLPVSVVLCIFRLLVVLFVNKVPDDFESFVDLLDEIDSQWLDQLFEASGIIPLSARRGLDRL